MKQEQHICGVDVVTEGFSTEELATVARTSDTVRVADDTQVTDTPQTPNAPQMSAAERPAAASLPEAGEGEVLATPADVRQRNAVEFAENLDKLPKFNWGAFFLPPLWGPAHGLWVTVLFYPLLVFVDSLIRGACVTAAALPIVLAAIAVLATLAFMVLFAVTSRNYAYLRVAHKVPLDKYLKRERIWAVADFIVALAAVIAATYYNLAIYLPQH